jgi:hypothetical protein
MHFADGTKKFYIQYNITNMSVKRDVTYKCTYFNVILVSIAVGGFKGHYKLSCQSTQVTSNGFETPLPPCPSTAHIPPALSLPSRHAARRENSCCCPLEWWARNRFHTHASTYENSALTTKDLLPATVFLTCISFVRHASKFVQLLTLHPKFRW